MIRPQIIGACVLLALPAVSSGEIINRIWTGDSSFNSFEVSTTAFEAAQFVGISSPAAVYRAWWPGDTTFTFDLRVDGIWTTVWTDTITLADGTVSLDASVNSVGAVPFDEGVITGFRFTSDNVQANFRQQINFLNSGTGTRFFFDTEPAIPGVGGVGVAGITGMMLFARRRRS